MRFAWICLLALGIAGCASVPEKPDATALAGIRKIGAMSMVAGEYHRKYTGVTVFGNEYDRSDISGWNLDQAYEGQIRDAITGIGGFEAVTIRYQAADFAALQKRNPDWDAAQERVRVAAGTAGADAVLVVVTHLSQDFLAGTNQFFGGVGSYARGAGEQTAVSVLHLVSQVYLVDGRTGKPLARRFLATDDKGRVRASPMRELSPKISRAPFKEWPAGTTEEVRAMLLALPAAAWKPTVQSLLSPEAR
jgi:hypothetical protein